MEGKYTLTLNINGNDFSDPIISNRKSISVKFVEAIVHFISQHDSRSKLYNINGFTACKLQLDGREEIFRATWNYIMATMASGMIGVLSIWMDTTNHILLVY